MGGNLSGQVTGCLGVVPESSLLYIIIINSKGLLREGGLYQEARCKIAE